MRNAKSCALHPLEPLEPLRRPQSSVRHDTECASVHSPQQPKVTAFLLIADQMNRTKLGADVPNVDNVISDGILDELSDAVNTKLSHEIAAVCF